MKYDTILFDLDGTLLNTLDDLADSVNVVMKRKGYRQRTKDEIREFIGDGVKLLITRSLPQGASEDEVLSCLELFREVYLKKMMNQTKPYDGILDVLKNLNAKGMKIGVVSNKPDEATKEMCKLFFNGSVDVAIGDNHERKKKPEPDNVLEALRQLDSEKENTLYAGDSNVDMQTAQNTGLRSIGVTWGYRSKETLIAEGADYLVDEPYQILTLLEKLNGDLRSGNRL